MSKILEGLKVVELAHEMGAWAGKLFADAGADVILVEPPGGTKARMYEPFMNDEPNPERSLYFWHYNTSKRSLTLDLTTPAGRNSMKKLLTKVDLFIECEQPGTLPSMGLGYDDIKPLNPRLVYASITPSGQAAPPQLHTDLTILAEGGPVWSCGYDDHTIPPVRGGGNQGYQMASHMAVMSALSALLFRGVSGRGQYIDVNAIAAANVTTEMATYEWMVAKGTVQRQTGRHATVQPSAPVQLMCKDGRFVDSSVPPRNPEAFQRMYDWLDLHGFVDQFPLAEVLKMGAAGGPINVFQTDDPEVALKLEAGREAITFMAQNLTAYEFFTEGQERNFQVTVVYSPDEAMEDAHIKSRNFPVQVNHPEAGRSFTYPGLPYRFNTAEWEIRHAPQLGEANAEVLRELD